MRSRDRRTDRGRDSRPARKPLRGRDSRAGATHARTPATGTATPARGVVLHGGGFPCLSGVEPFVESKYFATGVDQFRGDKKNTIVHRHEVSVASSSRWLGVGEASDSGACDIPLHKIF